MVKTDDKGRPRRDAEDTEGRMMDLEREIKRLREIEGLALWLSMRYLANPGSNGKCPHPNEFVACITPERGSDYHRNWRRLYALTHCIAVTPRRGKVIAFILKCLPFKLGAVNIGMVAVKI